MGGFDIPHDRWSFILANRLQIYVKSADVVHPMRFFRQHLMFFYTSRRRFVAKKRVRCLKEKR